MATDPAESEFNYSRHIRYWRRNLKTLLPHHYTGNDSLRMILALFILSALDILGDLDAALSPEERQGYIDWVYSCQLPEGGFRPWTGSDFGSLRNDENKIWDPAHVPGTFFALSILAILGDDLGKVNKKKILAWLVRMQRPDGSFGQTLGENGHVEGGKDSRFGYMATAIRWILRGNLEGPYEDVPDIDVDKFVDCVRQAETYDGGLSEAPYHEAHGGFASCAIFALSFVDRLPLRSTSGQQDDGRLRGLSNLPMTLHWLASRQTLTLDEDDATDTPFKHDTDSGTTPHSAQSFVKLGSYPSVATSKPSNETQATSSTELQWVGINGRCNKIADTCYAFWVCGPLKVLGHLDIVDPKPIRQWLLDKTQHLVGGFGKVPGDPPDIYHSYLGLVVLAIFGQAGLKDVDAALCVTNRVKEHIESLPWRRQLLGVDKVQ